MKMKINTIIGSRLYQGLMIGLPKPGMLEREIDDMKKSLGNPDPKHLAVLFSEDKWTWIGSINGIKWGTHGHIGGANLTFTDENDDLYDISIIWHYVNDHETIEDSLHEALKTFDWVQVADKYNAGDF